MFYFLPKIENCERHVNLYTTKILFYAIICIYLLKRQKNHPIQFREVKIILLKWLNYNFFENLFGIFHLWSIWSHACQLHRSFVRFHLWEPLNRRVMTVGHTTIQRVRELDGAPSRSSSFSRCISQRRV